MIKAILTDIEGTITRISFVKEVLFPYAAKHLPAFVRCNESDPIIQAQIEAVKQEIAQPTASLETVIDTLLSWIDADLKITPLKQLQGLIWQTGYQQGDFTGHIYPDAYQYLQQQHQAGSALYVYSSGSVKAQQLLFAHSDYGDIRPLFTNYFDTKVGHKQSSLSYQNIVNQIPFESHEVLFLSDVVEELDAAKQAGLQTLQLWRDNQSQSQAHPFIASFEQFDSERI
ncbi:2,3-diketo-5-methylthio-1-phosphopentane phosphatase [Pseudoalteromonas luteoviolacea]|uniref:Enolase-phosphatase E1 n=1 Tax=Pseudoalteromonas luteoviolacea TaxID=43657 RepID=A0A1C0TJX4_9GAMM|nr:acireductone synthase [Pseudoalteromonas luteoviolacea]MBQ4813873.1 acireductone synthase [Pseudoalteromonas luteoviolacea]OCQ18738.1 2,3-diketo-5-methylthio-1-phosphopentane phosphatase [Pseudoalteromonas luteoviolacea]